MNEIVCQVISQLLLGNSNLTSVFCIFLIFLWCFIDKKSLQTPLGGGGGIGHFKEFASTSTLLG